MRALRFPRLTLAAAGLLAAALVVFALALPARAEDDPAAGDDLGPALRAALVKLRITAQGYDVTEPWKKNYVRTRSARGVVIAPHTILTPASYVRDHLTIEVMVEGSARRYPARLKHVDRQIGLALVEITDEVLRDRCHPLPLGDPVVLDDTFDVYQLGDDNMVERYDARVARVGANSTQLTLRVKTSLGESGDGQVGIKDGAIVGLVTGTRRSSQEATLVALESLRHYLDDHADGVYDGLPDGGPYTHDLLRDDLRAHYGLTDAHHGVVVRRTIPGRTGFDELRAGDVILALDGQDIDDEGMFTHPVHGRMSMTYLLRGKHHRGDRIPARILRDGQEQQVSLELVSRPNPQELVPDRDSGEQPSYMVVGGLVVLEMTTSHSISRSEGGVIIRRMRERADWDRQPGEEPRRIVFASHLLKDRSNQGVDGIRQHAIAAVNGQPIRAIGDVAKALETPLETATGHFHVFRFEGLTSDFVLPAQELAAIDARIAETYGVTQLRHLAADDED